MNKIEIELEQPLDVPVLGFEFEYDPVYRNAVRLEIYEQDGDPQQSTCQIIWNEDHWQVMGVGYGFLIDTIEDHDDYFDVYLTEPNTDGIAITSATGVTKMYALVR